MHGSGRWVIPIPMLVLMLWLMLMLTLPSPPGSLFHQMNDHLTKLLRITLDIQGQLRPS